MSGNPTRDALDNVDRAEGLKYFGFDPGDKRMTVLVFGGSLGAASINHSTGKLLKEIMQQNVRIIWQTGVSGYDAAFAAAGSFDAGSISVRKFIDRMEYAYAASDLVICRAGATSVAELTRTGKPS